MAKEESLAEWLKRIQSVGYKDEKKEELRFTYEGGEEDFTIEKDDFGRYVEVTNKKKTIPTEEFPEGYHFLTVRYLLIEDVPEGKDLNFQDKKYIFLTEINFEGKEFDQEVNFKDSIFTRNISFCNVTFKENVSFSDGRHSYTTLFLGEAEFKGTTFSKEANFSNIKFSREANFGNTTFSGETNFWATTFSKNADFQNITFSKDVDFQNTTFSEAVFFYNTAFSEKVYFGGITFPGWADFEHAEFSKEANFRGTKFSGWANFKYAIFSEMTNFKHATFSKEANFYFSEFCKEAFFSKARFVGETDFSLVEAKFLDFSSVKWGEEGEKNTSTLNLRSADIEGMDYHDTKFPQRLSQHTYLILKNLAIEQNDTIRALDFYRQEMDKHYQELKWRAKPNWLTKTVDKLISWIEKTISFFSSYFPQADKLILAIEKVVSSYGTNPFRALLFLIVFNTLLVAINILDPKENFSVKLVMSFFTFRDYPLNGTHLAALILNPFLIYEVIKSLRKFSRKL